MFKLKVDLRGTKSLAESVEFANFWEFFINFKKCKNCQKWHFLIKNGQKWLFLHILIKNVIGVPRTQYRFFTHTDPFLVDLENTITPGLNFFALIFEPARIVGSPLKGILRID